MKVLIKIIVKECDKGSRGRDDVAMKVLTKILMNLVMKRFR
jgi:hypothetical protein